MIKIKTLILKNFLSYGAVPTIIDLDKAGTTLILGEDLDNTASGVGANGVGKSTIINALTYAIYDKTISDISKDNLVNNINKKKMEVTLELEKDGKTYVIKRFRKVKAGAAGNYTKLEENGVDITPDSSTNINKKIEEIIGIPFDIFVRVTTISATHRPFLDLPVRHPTQTNQTDIIEELFDVKMLSEKANLLKKVISDTEKSLEIQMARVDQLDKERERHKKQVEAAEQRLLNWNEQNREEIFSIQGKLKKLENVDIEHQRELHNRLTDIDNRLNLLLSEQREIERDIKSHNKSQNSTNNELLHLRDAKCPYCLQQYQDTQERIFSCETKLEQLALLIASLEPKLIEIDTNIEELVAQRKHIKDQITVNDVDELLEIKSKVSHYNQKLEELQQATNPFVEPLQELQDVAFDDINMEKVNELNTLVEHQRFLLKLLTKKDSFVRKIILNKNIPFLNIRLSHYLLELGLPHAVEFTHEMTASISQFGRPMDFGNLSNGQRARVNLALSLAFRDVSQSMHNHINICMFDEVFDVGLDTVGVQNAVKMLKRKARNEKLSLYIISHRDEVDNAFDRKMIVQLSKGFSHIVQDE